MKMNLEGIRVVALTHWVAGPLAGQILAEWGAEVLHIERVKEGDATRQNGPFVDGQSLYYRAFNRDVESVTLDIAKPDGLEILLELIEKADVFLTNYQVSFLQKCGLTFEKIKERNHRIIITCISGFGLTGRYKDKKAFDMVIQAMSGQMACTGEPDGIPYKTGTICGDYIGAYQAVIGTCIALLNRDRTGEGNVVDVSITDALICGLEWRIPEYRLTGKTSLRTGNRRPTLAPCNLYHTKDGYVYISASGQKIVDKLFSLIQDPRLYDDRFADNKKRVENVEELDGIIEEWLENKTSAEAVAAMEKAGVPCGPLLTPEDLAKDDYVDEKEIIMSVDDPELGTIPYVGSPIKMEHGYRKSHTGAPKLGQHTETVYRRVLGWDEETFKKWRDQGVI